MSDPVARLDVFKALGDNTRYAIYLELARSPRPQSTAEVASSLGLHVNTVRPHLERMREVGLLEVRVEPSGAVGRPQHRYCLAPEAPSLGLEASVFPLATRLLLEVAAAAGAGEEEAAEVGREQGRSDGRRARDAGARGGEHAPPAPLDASPCVAALVERLAVLGFDPVQAADEARATIAFGRCPFQDLAESNPALVCGLHRGLVEGFVDSFDEAEVAAFRSLVDRDACQVDLRVDLDRSGAGAGMT
jgi:predicted ArsR family transcriptional regulator